MKSCPNPNSNEWKAAVAAIGEFEAMRDFIEYGTIRNIDEIRVNKPNLFSEGSKLKNTTDTAIQEKYFPTNVQKSSDVVEKIANSKHPLAT